MLLGIIATGTVVAEVENMPLAKLEQRLTQIDARLRQLANYSLGGGIGAIGYRSAAHRSPQQQEWIEIDFGKTIPLDEVILVPAIRRDTANGFQADAFPMRFRLIAGGPDHAAGRIVAEYSCDDRILPRIAPVIIPCDGIEASWIRIEAVELSLRAFDERYVFQLSEILAFSEAENIALQRPVTASSKAISDNPGWEVRYVVDGLLPYLMDAAEGRKSVAYLTPTDIAIDPSLTVDLGRPYPISSIRLHAVDQSDTVPQAFAGDFGIPDHLIVEGANRTDFSDAEILLDLRHDTIYQTGPIMMHVFPETTCRYVRFRVKKQAATDLYGGIPPQMGFAEIEILSRGMNLAMGKPVSANYTDTLPYRPIGHLTDGLNMYGDVLPLREWMQQLALRHELETERPRVAAELNRRYAHQKTNLRRLGVLTTLLLAGTIIIVLVDRMIRQRAVHRTRQRIAADLHDELGANLHAIGLLGDLATNAKESPEKQEKLLQRIRALTERTGAAARYCTNMLEARGLYEDLVEDMKRTAARITADLEHDLSFEGEEMLRRLKARRRIDLFLFYKECLINIIRHSGATYINTRLVADPRRLKLVITDNGHGLNGEIPSSLKRRARLLGGQINVMKPQSGGTRICLLLKLNKFGVI